MTFASLQFIIFFAVVFALNLIFKGRRARQAILLVASYVFYGYWDWRFMFLMLFVVIVNYLTGLAIEKGHKKLALTISVIVSLGVLGLFKYFNFFMDNIYALVGTQNAGALEIILPVGISFYTFQAMSYSIDVYRGKIPVCKSFVKLALYISFFPQLVAGPIVRASDFLPQLEKNTVLSLKRFGEGAQIFLFGLFKKIVIADTIAIFVDDVFRAPGVFSGATIILAVIAYSIQIYCDFSGYSDMAIGAAKCLGYELCPNFNMPYIARNISEFWKRWHISLSTWLMDYLYIPLGGNRRGFVRTLINLMITMLLGGLWHGASWNFVLWGAVHGVLLIGHRIYKKIRGTPKPRAITAIASTVLTYILVALAWVLFRSPDLPCALEVYSRMATLATGVSQIFVPAIAAIVIIVIGYAVGCLKNHKNGFYPILDTSRFYNKILIAVAVMLLIGFAYIGSNPFIYFQF